MEYGPPRSSSDESRAASASRRRRSSRVDVVVCMVGLHANRNAVEMPEWLLLVYTPKAAHLIVAFPLWKLAAR